MNINSKNRDFVLIAGDVTNLGLADEYNKTYYILRDLNIPFIIAVGNHDLLNRGSYLFSKMFGDKNFSFDYGDNTFIFVNNNNWESPREFYSRRWLEGELLKTKKNIYIVAHCPYDDAQRFSRETIDYWRGLFETHNIRYYLNGHNHNYGESEWSNTKIITVGSTGKSYYVTLFIEGDDVYHEKTTF